jgi:hypothetical protein
MSDIRRWLDDAGLSRCGNRLGASHVCQATAIAERLGTVGPDAECAILR